MPYLTKERKQQIQANPGVVATFGDLNYLITRVVINIFKQHMRYEAIHILRRDFVTDPKNNPLIQAIRRDFSDRFKVSDIYTAAALAFEEFYRVVGSFYEDKKIVENGMVEEYQEVLDILNAPAEPKVAEQPVTVAPTVVEG